MEEIDVPSLARLPSVARALEVLRETDDRTLADQVELVQIPAPPFGEEARGARVRERFAELGLQNVATDEVGNVVARLPGGRGARAPVLLAAHLDTVFPAGTDLRVRRDGSRIAAPGIADNARGLAAILALARAMLAGGVASRHPLVFAATVGEEGRGDLRGVKHLFRDGSPWREAAGFIALDGTGCRRIVHRALGSRRLRATVTGPGGHSWADWGRANPIHALGVALADVARYTPPLHPRTTLTAGRMQGGTSVNVIPREAWVELDLRSEGAAALADLEARVRQSLQAAVRDGNERRQRGTAALELRIDVIGDRPSGEIPADTPVVAAARAATRRIGQRPELIASSTDANVPIALGIPAVALGAGGRSGATHTLDEWYTNEGGPEGLERVLLAALGLAGVERR